jgi:hypothetical protein
MDNGESPGKAAKKQLSEPCMAVCRARGYVVKKDDDDLKTPQDSKKRLYTIDTKEDNVRAPPSLET